MLVQSYFSSAVIDGDSVRCSADAMTAGPWAPGLQHGGPPAALLVAAAEQAAADVTEDGTELLAMRLGAEFLGPVPVGDVAVTTEILRRARSAVLVGVSLSAGNRLCLQGRVWLVRRADTTALAPATEPLEVPDRETGLGADFPYHDTIEWRSLGASMRELGPGVTWARPRRTVLPGVPLSGLQRAVLIGDSSSGISSELDWDEWSFLNVDLDVHLSRPVHGEWLRFDARTTLGTDGAALARSTVADVHGEVGATAQTLVLARRRAG